MNKTEKQGYAWLQAQGYGSSDIAFQGHRSPDFLTVDGLGWEVKLARNNTVTFYASQVESLNKLVGITILIFSKYDPAPTPVPFCELHIPGAWKQYRFVMAQRSNGTALTIRVEDDLLQAFADLANAEHRSTNKQITVLMEQAVMRAALVERRTDPQHKDGATKDVGAA